MKHTEDFSCDLTCGKHTLEVWILLQIKETIRCNIEDVVVRETYVAHV